MAENLLTKSAFAAVLGVDRSQPTRWAQQGMPVEADGRVDAVRAALWVRENIDELQRSRRSIGTRQIVAGERRSWIQELVFAYYSAANEAGRTAAELLLPFLPLPTVQAVAEEVQRRMRVGACECLAEDFPPPRGCATWADDSRFQGPVMAESEWEELVAENAAGKLVRIDA